MTRSESINELAAALAKAQGEILAAKKDSENPHFKSKYADLGSVWDAIRAALTKHGLAVVQSPRLITTSEKVWFVEIETTMLHASGQSVSDVLAVPLASPTAQGIGSACTYARRYALAAFAGVAAAGDDDDANAASEPPARQAPKPTPKPRPTAKIPEGAKMATALVMGIVQRPLPDGRIKFVVSCDDRNTYQSLHLEHATTAKEAHEAGLPIAITYTTTQEGRIIQSLSEVEPPV